MSVILLVLKLERFNSFKDEHPSNIPLILVTLLVLKLDRFISFHDEHPKKHRTHINYIISIKCFKIYRFDTFAIIKQPRK